MPLAGVQRTRQDGQANPLERPAVARLAQDTLTTKYECLRSTYVRHRQCRWVHPTALWPAVQGLEEALFIALNVSFARCLARMKGRQIIP